MTAIDFPGYSAAHKQVAIRTVRVVADLQKYIIESETGSKISAYGFAGISPRLQSGRLRKSFVADMHAAAGGVLSDSGDFFAELGDLLLNGHAIGGGIGTVPGYLS